MIALLFLCWKDENISYYSYYKTCTCTFIKCLDYSEGMKKRENYLWLNYSELATVNVFVYNILVLFL